MLIGAAHEAEGILRCFFDVFPEEGTTLVVVFFVDSAEGEDGGGKVDKGDEAVARSSGLIAFGTKVGEGVGDVNEKGDVQSGPANIALVAGHAGAVIAVEKDNGVFGEPGFLEVVELLADPGVELGEAVVVLGPVFTNFRGVWVVWGNGSEGGIVMGVFVFVANLGFVRAGLIEDGKKRLSLAAVFVVCLAAAFVPIFVMVTVDVVVGLAGVGAEVAGFSEGFGKELEPVGEINAGAHVVSSDGRGIHAGNDTGAGGCADGCVG